MVYDKKQQLPLSTDIRPLRRPRLVFGSCDFLRSARAGGVLHSVEIFYAYTSMVDLS